MFNPADYIGIPFEYGGRGPDKFDCYGLIKEILSFEGIQIPDYASPSEGAKIIALFQEGIALWEECGLQKGAVLVFRVPGNLHVGYYLGGNRFIHTWEGSHGVVIERLSDWKRRLQGAYKYVG